MLNEKYSRGPAVSDGLEVPSDRADLVIILRSAGGAQVIWQREDSHTDPSDDHTALTNAWFATFLGWSVGGYSTA